MHALTHRVTSLAAEIAFFALLSLPPLVLALAAVAAWLGSGLAEARQEELSQTVEHYLTPFLTEDVVTSVVLPTLTEALQTPRYDIISLGFIFALWSGSRAMAAAYMATALLYEAPVTRPVRMRAVSFGLYLAALVLGALGLPLLVIGPDLMSRALPDRWEFALSAYWVVVGLLAIAALATIYRLAGRDGHWVRSHLAGAFLALLLAVAASLVFRWTLAITFGGGRTSMTIYGPLTAPIIVLIWFYVLALAVLVGASFNRVLMRRTQQRWERDLADTWQ